MSEHTNQKEEAGQLNGLTGHGGEMAIAISIFTRRKARDPRDEAD